MDHRLPPVTVVVNPARAGMILTPCMLVVNYIGKPRASGDDPWARITTPPPIK